MAVYKCLFCDKPAGSKEHVFPAALGGRRVDKGIFCETDNNAMGSVAATLAEQLSYFNSQLGVISDNSGEARVHTTTDPETGIKLAMAQGSIAVAEPTVLSDKQTDEGRAVEMLFGNQQQMDEWRRQIKAQGGQIRDTKSSGIQRRFSRGFHIPMSFGGAEGLRAIAYLGLTYLAHRHPELARRSELLPFIQYVQTDNGDGFIAWEASPLRPAGYPESYRFQHRIALSADAAGFISGHVDLFSTLSFSIRFGTTLGQAPFTDIVDINPLVEFPPNDRMEKTADGVTLFSYVDTPAGTENLAGNITNGTAQRQVAALLRDIQEWTWEQRSAVLLPQINALSGLPVTERRDRLLEILEVETQRLLSMMDTIAKTFRQQHGGSEVGNNLSNLFDALVDLGFEDRQTSPRARAVHALARMTMATQIEQYFQAKGRVDPADLRDLFLGVSGPVAMTKMMITATGLEQMLIRSPQT